jgi:hypothetical protein
LDAKCVFSKIRFKSIFLALPFCFQKSKTTIFFSGGRNGFRKFLRVYLIPLWFKVYCLWFIYTASALVVAQVVALVIALVVALVLALVKNTRAK